MSWDDDEATHRAVARPELREATFELRVVEGPDTGASLAVSRAAPGPALVGKGKTASLALTDPRVSRHHLAVTLAGLRLHVVDRGSTNGTAVGGLAVVDAFLVGGETIAIGSTQIRVERTSVLPRLRRANVPSFGRALGASDAMQPVYARCAEVAPTGEAVLLEGAAGTGKDLFAECLHEASDRRQQALVVVACAGRSDAEVARDLFGGDGTTPALEDARGGTLVLDEVAELGVALQHRLLFALDGVDCRLVCTSRRSVERATEDGWFLAELHERVAAQRIELPPLVERTGDVAILARHFWAELRRPPEALTDERIAQLEQLPWPANVRELRTRVTCLEEPIEPAEEDILTLDLPFREARRAAIAAFERRFVERLLAQHGGNVSRASAASGIARRYLQMIKRRRSV